MTATTDTDKLSGSAAGPGGQGRGRQRALPFHRPGAEGRRSPYGTTPVTGTAKPTVRHSGNLAYRSADGLLADYAHRGTFFDLSV